MTVHITNLYGFSYKSTAQIAQNQTTKIACDQLDFKELGIYHYDSSQESFERLQARFDGIIASVAFGDTVIFQSPSWNTIDWDIKFIDHLSAYQVKKIIFIHDVVPLMFPTNRYLLPQFIDYYNRADVLIVPTREMADFLKENGLTVNKIVLQEMWDHIADVGFFSLTETNKKVINFAGDPSKFKFVNHWNFSGTPLHVFSDKKTWIDNQNIISMGWQTDRNLLSKLRISGGFGLLWEANPYWAQYMKMNVSYKLSTYLAAGIPVIINKNAAQSKIVQHEGVGIVVSSLDEAVEIVQNLNDQDYNKIVKRVNDFAELVRDGFFTKKVLTEAIFKLHCR